MTKSTSLVVASVFDSAVGYYFQPFFARSRAEALRSFKDACNQEGHNFNKHSGDFSLFILATWDEENGKFEQLDAPASMGTALEHIDREVEPRHRDVAQIADKA